MPLPQNRMREMVAEAMKASSLAGRWRKRLKARPMMAHYCGALRKLRRAKLSARPAPGLTTGPGGQTLSI